MLRNWNGFIQLMEELGEAGPIKNLQEHRLKKSLDAVTSNISSNSSPKLLVQNPKRDDELTVEKRYTLLTPMVLPKREDRIVICPPIADPATDLLLHNILYNRPSTFEPMALDFETQGLTLDRTEAGFSSRTVGIGLADSRGSWFIDFRDSHPSTYEYIMRKLEELQIPLLAHNLNFDGMWPMRDFGIWLNWRACTYAVYKSTATEGWPGQKWGLKDAQVDLLGWKDSNESELDNWLVSNGYGAEGRPNKGEMWRAPKNILGKYCALDADSTYQLYTEIQLPVLRKFKALNIYCTVYYPKYSRILIEQSLSGIRIDITRLEEHSRVNMIELSEAEKAIFRSSVLRPFLDKHNQLFLDELKAEEPAQYLKTKKRPPEPSKFRSDGKPSKVHATWVQNESKYAPIVSKNWLKWEEKWKAAQVTEHFNYRSGPQKKRMFFEWMYPQSNFTFITRRNGDRETREDVFQLITDERKVYLPPTKSGQAPTDRKALRQMGEVGKLFLTINDLTKEQQFIEGLKENSFTGRLYPQFRVPGTLTGRLSGGGGRPKKNPDGSKSKGFNIQQIPKSPGFLRTFVPDSEMYTFVDCDHTAVEQVVLAELSKDPSLWKLYGPNVDVTYSTKVVTDLLDTKGIKWEIIDKKLAVFNEK